MIPYRDENPTSTFAAVTYTLIAVNIFIYVRMLLGGSYQAEICQWGAYPGDFTGQGFFSEPPCFFVPHAPPRLTWLTHMFLHGGLLHLAGNMLYLGIFGNNVEDALGHLRFLVFYLLCGMAALTTQILATPDSMVPMVGASGAIAGVLGAYMVFFPAARVQVLLPLFIFFTTLELPALLMLLLWFGMQVFNAWIQASLDLRTGVAWYAHAGGFAAGVLLAFIFPKRRRWQRWRVY